MLDHMDNINIASNQPAASFGYTDRSDGRRCRPLDNLELGLSRVGVDIASLSDRQLDLIRQHVAEHGDVTILDLILLLGQGSQSGSS